LGPWIRPLDRRALEATNSLGRGSSGCRIASSQCTEHAGRGGSDGDEETEATNSSYRNGRDHEAQAEEDDLAREIAQRPACVGPSPLAGRGRRLLARSLAEFDALGRWHASGSDLGRVIARAFDADPGQRWIKEMLTELSQRDDRWTRTNRRFSGPLGEARRRRCPLLGG
jgi:hypothetical protein